MTDPIPADITKDPITLAVIQSSLQQVCDEMDMSFSRAAFSPIIAEANDRSDGIYSADNGELIAQGALGLPVFVGTMQFSTRVLIEMINSGQAPAPEPGDIYIVNDPYLGGTHLMDVRFAMPYYVDGEIFCWLSNTGHWPDIGGTVPGGFSANATAVEQEGLRLPPVKLFKQGKLDSEIYSIICSNVRVADQRIGDVKAQSAALLVGEERLNRLVGRYSAPVLKAAIAELKRRAATQMRQRLTEIKDGEYTGTAIVDSDGVVNKPLTIQVNIKKSDQQLHIDFNGTSEPCMGPMNSVLATTQSSVYLALRHIYPDVPINAGAFEPIHIADPVDTFLYARYPRPVSGCAAEVSQRIAEAVFAALVPALPTRVSAAPAGTSGNFALGGFDPQHNRSFVMYQLSGGGYGGNHDHDGLTNGCSTIGISKSPPIEVMEQYFPVLYREYSLREGSGGAGEYRGGFGIKYSIELLRGQATASFVMDHGRVGPQGVLGGSDGMPNTVVVWRDGEAYTPLHLSKDQGIAIKAGDRVEVATPGGGGFGNPANRPIEKIKSDVENGYYTIPQIKESYGVDL